MRRIAPLLLLVLAACATPDPDLPATDAVAPPDTLVLDAALYGDLPDRPTVPLRVERACPFECCSYSTWITSADVLIYATPDDTTAMPIATLSTGTELDAQTGHLLLTRLGSAVSRDSAQVWIDYDDERFVADGERALVLDYIGEGFYRAWYGGATGQIDGTMAPSDDSAGFALETEAEAQWWARVRTPDGRIGWLWMDRSEVNIPYGC